MDADPCLMQGLDFIENIYRAAIICREGDIKGNDMQVFLQVLLKYLLIKGN